MDKCMISKVWNKNGKEIVSQYCNKEIYIDDLMEGCKEGYELKIKFCDGSFFTHEVVNNIEQDDYGLHIVTTNKEWCIDWI